MIFRVKIYDFIRQEQIKRFIRIRCKIGFSDKIENLKRTMQTSAIARISFAEKEIRRLNREIGMQASFWYVDSAVIEKLVSSDKRNEAIETDKIYANEFDRLAQYLAVKDIIATSTFNKFLPFWERYLHLLKEKYTYDFKYKKIVPCSLELKDYYRQFAFEGCMRIIPKIAEQDVIKCRCKSEDFVIIRTNICEERFVGYGMSLNKVRKLFIVCLDCGCLIDSYWVMDWIPNTGEY